MAPLMRRRPYVTYAVAGVSVALFGLQMLWGAGQPHLSALRMGASLRSLIEAGQVWRLLAPMLLHGSVAHLALNMIALFGFGTFLERFLGGRRYLLLYVLSGLGGSLASALRPEEVLSVGASGGIWGLMVAGAVLVTVPRGRLPEMVSNGQRRRAWVPIVINVVYSFKPGIDLLAHVGGGVVGGLLFLSGLMTAGLPVVERGAGPVVRREGILVSAAAGLAGLALLGSVLGALLVGQPWELQAAPALRPVAVNDAVVHLPNLIAPPTSHSDGQTFSFGSLGLDPVAFVVSVPPTVLTDEEAADAEGQLSGAVEMFKPALYEGFSEAVGTELRHLEGRPYLFHRQVAPDGRVGESYLLLEGKRIFSVLVFHSDGTSAPWRSVADTVPFRVQFP